jgi:heptosyltransferase-3
MSRATTKLGKINWKEQKVLLIQDNWLDLSNPAHPIHQLNLLGAKVYLAIRPINLNFSEAQSHPAVAGIIVYEGGRSLWSLLIFARSHPFDIVICHIQGNHWERHLRRMASYFLWKAQRKMIILQEFTDGPFQIVTTFQFLRESMNRIALSINEVASRPFIAIYNYVRGKKSINPNNVKRILFIRLDYIGDVVMASSLIDPLRERFPEAEIDLLLGPWSKSLFAADSRIHRIFTFAAPWLERRTYREIINDDPAMPRHLRELIQLLRKERYDIAIESHGCFFDSLVAYQSGARQTVGTSGAKFYNQGDVNNAFLLTHRVDYGSNVHPAVEQHARLAKALGCSVGIELIPRLQWSSVEADAAKTIIDTANMEGVRVAVHMYSGDIVRVWRKEKYIEAIKQLSVAYGNRICFFLIGSPDEAEYNKKVIEALPRDAQVYNVAGKLSLKQLSAFFAQMDLFIGNDSGPMHIADAAGTLVIALFIRKLSYAHTPRGGRNIILTTSDDNMNLDTITVAMVVQAVESMIQPLERKRKGQ